MTLMSAETVLEQLASGQRFRFAEWPIADVPQLPGLYTVWDGEQLLYIGMAGRVGAGAPIRGLRGRLNSHALGRRGGDQFCMYICDRLIVPHLTTSDQLAQLGQGKLSLDLMTKDYVRGRLSFRFVVTSDGQAAQVTERSIKRRGLLGFGKPLLNPDTAGLNASSGSS